MNAWISLNKAAKITGIDRKNLRGKLSKLKKNHPTISKKLVRKKNNQYVLKEPEIIVFFQTDFRKLKIKPFLENLVSRSNDIITIDSEIISKAKKLISRSKTTESEINIDRIIEQTTDPDEIARLAIAINICYDYSMGLESVEGCANKYQIDRNKFYRWCYEFSNLQSFYDQAGQVRKLYLNKRRVEEAEDNLDNIARGGKATIKAMDFEVTIDKKGKQVFTLTKLRVTTKTAFPDRESNIFILTNIDPQNWKKTIPFQLPVSSPKTKMDQFQNKSLEELDKLIEKLEESIKSKKLDNNESAETGED